MMISEMPFSEAFQAKSAYFFSQLSTSASCYENNRCLVITSFLFQLKSFLILVVFLSLSLQISVFPLAFDVECSFEWHLLKLSMI